MNYGLVVLTVNNDNFDSISPPQPCVLAGVDVQPWGVLKHLSDKSYLIWSDSENLPPHNLINITEGADYSVTREFINSMQGDKDFFDCLNSFSFAD